MSALRDRPLGIRLNNPGLIVKSTIAWLGEKTGLPEDHFESFDTAAHGLRALCKLLLTYWSKYGCNTVRKIVSRWAPPAENDTAAYILDVARHVGVGPDVPLNLLNAARLYRVCGAIVWHENGIQPYVPSMLYAAALAALGRSAVEGASAEELTDIDEADVPAVRKRLELGGASTITTKQPNGLYSVLATYDKEM